MRKRRGSAILWVMMMVVSTAAIALVASELGMSSIRDTVRYQDQKEVQYAWEGICAQIDADSTAGSLSLPATYTLSMNGATATVTVTDNSSNMANSMLATATVTGDDGRTYAESTIENKHRTASPWDYAMFSASSVSGGSSMTTGSSSTDGDVFVLGNYSMISGSQINGIASATGTVSSSGSTVTGGTVSNAVAPCSFPSISSANYLASATAVYLTNQTFTNYTFPTVAAGQPYPLVYCSGSLNITGTISGIGTFYVAGAFVTPSSISYANSSSHVAFILSLAENMGQNCVGYYYCPSTWQFSAPITVNGGIAASGFNLKKSSTVIRDDFVYNNPTNGYLMHLPGLWP